MAPAAPSVSSATPSARLNELANAAGVATADAGAVLSYLMRMSAEQLEQAARTLPQDDKPHSVFLRALHDEAKAARSK